jgi:hypothetical protein
MAACCNAVVCLAQMAEMWALLWQGCTCCAGRVEVAVHHPPAAGAGAAGVSATASSLVAAPCAYPPLLPLLVPLLLVSLLQLLLSLPLGCCLTRSG